VNRRDAQLLPRLLGILDDCDLDETPGEALQAVQQVRRILGGKGFQKLLEPVAISEVKLDHPQHDVAMRLRGLGLMLRTARSVVPDNNRALQAFTDALIDRKTIGADDLTVGLSCLRDLIAQLREAMGRWPGEKPGRNPDEDLAVANLREAMEMMNNRRWPWH
jgi:hypothetical protein